MGPAALVLWVFLFLPGSSALGATVYPKTEDCEATFQECVDGAREGSTIFLAGRVGEPARIGKPLRIERYQVVGPSHFEIVNLDNGELKIAFTDHSSTESGYRLRMEPSLRDDGSAFYDFDAIGGTGRREKRWGAAYSKWDRAVVGREYCLNIRSEDLSGWTPWSDRNCFVAKDLCVRNRSCRDDTPFNRTFTLERVRVVEGFVPFAGTYPTAGQVLTGIRLPRGTSQYRFVKTGHSSTECDDPSAYVEARSGESVDVAAVYGTARMETPVAFVVCTNATPLPNWISIELELAWK
jgi:hypothetical protein